MILALPGPLSTEHFVIRSFLISDAPMLYALERDPRVKQYLTKSREHTVAEYEGQIARGNYPAYAIIDQKTGKFAGRCAVQETAALFATDPPGADSSDVLEVVCVLSTAYQGQGFGEEIISALTEFAFRQSGVHRVYAETTHPAAMHINKKLGFSEIERDGATARYVLQKAARLPRGD